MTHCVLSVFCCRYGIATSSPLLAVVGFAVWAGATFAVLLCMDVLECFLHALRLHWVEFNGKFFYADGLAFQPLSFNKVEEPHIAEHRHERKREHPQLGHPRRF